MITYVEVNVDDACCRPLVGGKTYHWNTILEIQHGAAPSTLVKYGRMTQKIQVDLKWCNRSYIKRYKNLKVEQNVQILCVSRSLKSLNYNRQHQSFVKELGPIAIKVRTDHMAVGSYLKIGLDLLEVENGCKILSMQGAIVQTCQLQSRRNKDIRISYCKLEHFSIFKISGDDLKQDGSSEWTAQIPTCGQISPSSLKNSDQAAIRLAHHLEFSIFYKPANLQTKKSLVYTAKWPVILASVSVLDLLFLDSNIYSHFELLFSAIVHHNSLCHFQITAKDNKRVFLKIAVSLRAGAKIMKRQRSAFVRDRDVLAKPLL